MGLFEKGIKIVMGKQQAVIAPPVNISRERGQRSFFRIQDQIDSVLPALPK